MPAHPTAKSRGACLSIREGLAEKRGAGPTASRKLAEWWKSIAEQPGSGPKGYKKCCRARTSDEMRWWLAPDQQLCGCSSGEPAWPPQYPVIGGNKNAETEQERTSPKLSPKKGTSEGRGVILGDAPSRWTQLME